MAAFKDTLSIIALMAFVSVVHAEALSSTDKIIIGITCSAFGLTFIGAGVYVAFFYRKGNKTVQPMQLPVLVGAAAPEPSASYGVEERAQTPPDTDKLEEVDETTEAQNELPGMVPEDEAEDDTEDILRPVNMEESTKDERQESPTSINDEIKKQNIENF